MNSQPQYSYIDPVTGQPRMYPNLQQNQPMPMQPGFAYPYQGPPIQAHPIPQAMAYPNHIAPTPTAPPSYTYSQPTFQMPEPIIEWIPTTVDNASSLNDKAVVAGYEGYDGSPLWAIRAWHEGDLIPGKLAIKHKAAYVPWNGSENPVKNIEVCCARPEKVRWVEAKDGAVPPNAVPGGKTATGEVLFVGRAKEQRSVTPGKIHQSHKAMYISFGGQEIAHKTYEVLCTVH